MIRHARIALDPAVILGKPVIRGTRITVEQILRELGAGMATEEILAAHPHLTADDIRAAQAFAADWLAEETVPEALRDYVRRRVAEGDFRDPSDYVGILIREDRKRRAEARLEALLVEGLESGDAAPLDSAEWDGIRREVRERIGGRRRPA